MKRTPTLFDVPKDNPSRKENRKALLQAFKDKHGIWTHHASGLEEPWTAVWVNGARDALSDYGPEVATMTGMELIASYCRLLEEAELMAGGRTEHAAVELLSIWNELYPLP